MLEMVQALSGILRSVHKALLRGPQVWEYNTLGEPGLRTTTEQGVCIILCCLVCWRVHLWQCHTTRHRTQLGSGAAA